jgi:hypothetical protein
VEFSAEQTRHRDLGQLVETSRAMVAEQFQIAERLDRKARYQVATAGAFFAVVQALAVNAIGNAGLSDGWVATLGALALPPAFLTLAALIATSHAWRTQDEKDLPLVELRAIVDRVQRDDDLAMRELAHHYLNLVEARRGQNAAREAEVRRAAAATQLALVFIGLELLMVFIALIQ